jgi:excinuclease ABC subunit C
LIADIKDIIKSLPESPGIYRYYNKTGELLYVGKAKNIKKRVSSYFIGKANNRKTIELVSRIDQIDYTLVQSETDALLLENTLIKKYKPVFNIELKDDKTYPYIVIKNEPFPRIFLTRKKINDGSIYLGPFTSAGKVRELISFIRQNLPIRTCKLILNERNIKEKRFKVCLEYQLGNCKGPCEGLQDETDYSNQIHQIKNILNGNIHSVIRFLKDEMKVLAGEMKFEKAEIIKKKIQFLESYQSKSVVVNAKIQDADVFYFLREEERVYVNYLMVRNGAVIQSDNTRLMVKIEEDDEEIFSSLINNIRSLFNSNAKEIIVPFAINWMDPQIKVSIPIRGEKLELLELAALNARFLQKEDKMKRALLAEHLKSDSWHLLEQVQKKLSLKTLPQHIECFDNSNFQGSNPVSAMVCFKNGIPSKKDYRTFHVKTVEGIDDFATMKEAVFRRYSRMIKENESLPQLVIIDGGKGQLNAAAESMQELCISDKITLVGLAKKEENIFFLGDKHPLQLPINDNVLLFIRKIRDEVHRFGIQFHRKIRSKNLLKNEMEEIPGIGKISAEQLLKEYRSIDGLTSAGYDRIKDFIGKDKADKIWEHLKKRGRIEIQPRL